MAASGLLGDNSLFKLWVVAKLLAMFDAAPPPLPPTPPTAACTSTSPALPPPAAIPAVRTAVRKGHSRLPQTLRSVCQ